MTATALLATGRVSSTLSDTTTSPMGSRWRTTRSQQGSRPSRSPTASMPGTCAGWTFWTSTSRARVGRDPTPSSQRAPASITHGHAPERGRRAVWLTEPVNRADAAATPAPLFALFPSHLRGTVRHQAELRAHVGVRAGVLRDLRWEQLGRHQSPPRRRSGSWSRTARMRRGSRSMSARVAAVVGPAPPHPSAPSLTSRPPRRGIGRSRTPPRGGPGPVGVDPRSRAPGGSGPGERSGVNLATLGEETSGGSASILRSCSRGGSGPTSAAAGRQRVPARPPPVGVDRATAWWSAPGTVRRCCRATPRSSSWGLSSSGHVSPEPARGGAHHGARRAHRRDRHAGARLETGGLEGRRVLVGGERGVRSLHAAVVLGGRTPCHGGPDRRRPGRRPLHGGDTGPPRGSPCLTATSWRTPPRRRASTSWTVSTGGS